MLKVVSIGLFIFINNVWWADAEYGNHQGLYTHHLGEANLIIPRKVNHRGDLISHNLTHHHDQDRLEDDRLHYHIELDNRTLHLELEPSTQFVAPLMVIERHKREVRMRNAPKGNVNCHYHGHIRDHANSKVALSACNGIAGLLHTQNGEYWIEPSKNHVQGDPNAQQLGHPHVIFQRSVVEDTPDANKVLKKRRKKKKQRRKKKRHSTNCGTKEPKRVTETRIEWQPQGKVIVQGGRRIRRINSHNNNAHTGFRLRNSNSNKKKRARRSVSSPRHVEALVVADPSMISFHQDGNVEQYLLTIMNMVSLLYKDPSIGNSIHVVVVKIILLEEDEAHPDLNVTHIAGSTLENFCRWQRTLNPSTDRDPHHHDVAILITRKNICSAEGCSTLGVANVGGMCRPDRSCSVNEDNGITLAHTITHELGHNFGMYHDTAKTGCDHRIGSILHIMTPSFEADTIQVSWSNCSRRDITHFLDQGLGKCLEDPPESKDYTYPELPPGAMYKANAQCRHQFNSTNDSVVVCSKLDEICSQLWCLENDICTTLLKPAAPGTHCGKHKWCQNQKCVAIEEIPLPVDGGWGNWSDWSECSRSCGAGIAKQSRQCDHPLPAHGGSFCIGERTRYKICNIDPCPEQEQSFRAQQCSSHDNDTFKGQTFTWLPHFDSHDPCELYCTDTDDTIIVPFGDSAADGTPCNIGTNDMCIAGICRKVGCDWAVDSNTTEDQCGVCGGDGLTCKTIKDEVSEKVNSTEGYHEIVVIPAGSRHIMVEEIQQSKNYIGIGKSNSKEFYLNGDGFISMPGEYAIAGSLGLYDRENEQEKLKLPGPIHENISIYVVFRGKNRNTGIRYEYTLPANSSLDPIYIWKLGDWTPCSATCGGGVQHRLSVCLQKGKGIVSDTHCTKLSKSKHRERDRIKRSCNEDPCPPDWWIGPWQPCPVTCQSKNDPRPIRRRSIMCSDQNEIALPDSRCSEKERPHDTEPCPGKLPNCRIDENNHNLGNKNNIEPENNNTI